MIKNIRISETIVEEIKTAILNGELKPGDRLPPEKILAERFGVSKSSLREALRVLEAHGHLEIRRGVQGGAFVRKMEFAAIKDGLAHYFLSKHTSSSDYFKAWKVIEPEIIKEGINYITDETIHDLEETIDAMMDGPASHQTLSRLDTLFHQTIAEIADNSILGLVVHAVQTGLTSNDVLPFEDELFLTLVCQGHRDIVEALKRRDPKLAGTALYQHIVDMADWISMHKDDAWCDTNTVDGLQCLWG